MSSEAVGTLLTDHSMPSSFSFTIIARRPSLNSNMFLACAGVFLDQHQDHEVDTVTIQEDASHDADPDLETVHLVGNLPVSLLLTLTAC